MSIDPDRFRRPIIDALSKRAAHLCSNPDCRAITSGPADDETRSITVGEAAHIYGAKPEAARYDAQMTAAERSSITNAIWLCRNCHKIVDANPGQFPAALLFEWRLDHERHITDNIGKTGDRLRQKVIDAELEGLEGVSYLARQIVIDKPDGWEYRLTAEILRSVLSPLLSRWHALKRGLYAKPVMRVSLEGASDWLGERVEELSNLVPALTAILNGEFTQAWGASGEPGSPISIMRTCGLFRETCEQLLVWEENVRFTLLPSEFEEIGQLLSGTAGRVLDKVGVIPAEFTRLLDDEELVGTHKIEIVIDLPDGWQDSFMEALSRVQRYWR